MHLVPTQEEVVALLRKTGGLRDGHFEDPGGRHVSEYLQVALSMRHYEVAKILSVGLSRQLRAHSDLRAIIPELSIVAPDSGGLPVAYGVCEALRARKVYWAEREDKHEPLRFRQYLEVEPGEKVVLVDESYRIGLRIGELKNLVESKGGEVVAIAVLIHQPHPFAVDLGKLPFYYLARLDATYSDPSTCKQCKRCEPVERVWS